MFAGMFGSSLKGISCAAFVLGHSHCWVLVLLSLPASPGITWLHFTAVETEAGPRSCAWPIAAFFQAAQRVLQLPCGTNKLNFSFFSWRGQQPVCSAGLSSALNLLRVSSSLAVGWENTLMAVCGTKRLSSVPQPLPWVLLLSIS